MNKFCSELKKKNVSNSNENETEYLKDFSFIDYLVREITSSIIEKHNYLRDLAQQVHSDEFEEIIKIYEEIRKEQVETIDFGINLEKEEEEEEDNESITILKAFYESFKEKKLTPKSEDFKKIIEYFNNFTQNTKDTELIRHPTIFTNEEQAISDFKLVFEGLKKYKNEEEDIIDVLAKDLNKLEKIIFNKKKYIYRLLEYRVQENQQY